MSDADHGYDVQANWATAVALGDTLAVRAGGGVDDRWVEAFEIVLDEHQRLAGDQSWSAIDFEYDSDEEDELRFVLFVRQIDPGVRAPHVRASIVELMKDANTAAQAGTHVYELARELREPQEAPPRGSVPPPSLDPLADELSADAA